ncbi:hypothetical protein RRF57_007440 [Xylaria bambusicola]|uniref:Major facilitator superfamily (MFS) profile domain-containing protein n=1 Tax=Xylaria bambusicola TaxID=326684 RepID=A0AAN7URZ0_9PEZI
MGKLSAQQNSIEDFNGLAQHTGHSASLGIRERAISTYAFFLYFTGAQTGPIFYAYPVRFLVVTGSIGIVASVFLFSVSKGLPPNVSIIAVTPKVNAFLELYQYLLSFGVLGGISASLLFNPSISAVGHWFYRKRALATGVACTAGGIGGVVFPLIILYIAPRLGFGWALRIVSLVNVAAGITTSCLLRKRLPPNKKAGASVDFKSLSEPRFASTALATFLIEFAVFISYTYICSHAIHAGLDRRTAYLSNVLLNTGAVPGRALPGYIADRFGSFNTMCITALACVATILALWYTAGTNTAQVISFAPLFGFWSGAAISLTPVCIGQVCRTEDYGKRSGTAFFLASFGTLIGVPIAGVILEKNNGSYNGLIIFAGVLYLAALVAFIVARGLSTGWRLTVLF